MKKLIVAMVSLLLLVFTTSFADQTLNITFTGDVTLGYEERMKWDPRTFCTVVEEQGYDYFLSNFADMFKQDDLTVVNLEGPLTDNTFTKKKGKFYRFHGPTHYVNILTGSGIDACNLANNHCPADFGKEGLESTQKTLTEAKLGWFGGKHAWIFEKDGLRIGFFGMNSTAVHKNKAWMKSEIARMKQEEGVNAVVAVFHAGTEYSKHRHRIQEKYAHEAIDMGADLVIMHHPHVIQGVEIYKNRTIFYSLGNFCFGGNKEVRAIETMVVSACLSFNDEGEYQGQQMKIIPAHISTGEDPSKNNYRPGFVTGEEAEQVIRLVQNDTDFELPAMAEDGTVTLDYVSAE